MSNESDAVRLRAHLGELFGGAPEHFFFTPSSLTALRIAFGFLGIRRLVLSAREYYTEAHFPGVRVVTVPSEFVASASADADAVILSVAGWRGDDLQVVERFREARSRSGSRTLLIADYSHAGACGFPMLESLGADLVFGAPSHWLVPDAAKDQLGFLYAGESELCARLTMIFRSFYLATTEGALDFQSRWVTPSTVRRLLDWLERNSITRTSIAVQHARNMALARQLARELGTPMEPATAIVWSDEASEHPTLEPYRTAKLVWYPPCGGTRVLCRDDILRGATPALLHQSVVSREEADTASSAQR